MNWWYVLTLFAYLPFVLSVYILITRYQQINKIWVILLGGSLLFGAAPSIAFLFLLVYRKTFLYNPDTLDYSAQEQSVSVNQTVTPVLSDYESISQPPIARKKTISALGMLISVFLVMYGLVVVGFFVFISLIFLSIARCAGSSKCM